MMLINMMVIVVDVVVAAAAADDDDDEHNDYHDHYYFYNNKQYHMTTTPTPTITIAAIAAVASHPVIISTITSHRHYCDRHNNDKNKNSPLPRGECKQRNTQNQIKRTNRQPTNKLNRSELKIYVQNANKQKCK